ncbi:DUF5642 family protein [Jiangella alkaliphila]|uniref:PknH-like extracellular domain-containing protein n=1 Tax=Jiangella alkaliphila TaxID=419479 RepID=A0A1H2I7J5_9ACTN|nr:DUF5642 family protein [Jiangella alkaliphila]SDU40089.1 hypothetical protein SAMN04488563_1498 [Jiangella alkaliphila]
MRKIAITALIATTLLLTGCGGDDESGDDATTTNEPSSGGDEPAAEDTPAEDTPAEDEPADDAAAGGAVDLDAALLTAGDLPDGAQIMPIDVTEMATGMDSMAGLIEGATYEPAECQDNSADPLRRDGVEAAAMTAMSEVDVFMQAVYTGASEDDIAAVEDYYERCGEVSFSGEMADQAIEMTTTTEIVDAPSVDADHVVALDSTMAGSGLPGTVTRVVYVIDGDLGMYVAANPDSAVFDIDALTATALEKLRAARG